MNTRRFGFARRIAVVAAAAAVSLIGVAGVAQADDSNPVTGVGNIDASQHGSITIHKRVGDEGAAGDGSKLTNPSGDALNGVTFQVQKVDVAAGKTLDVTDPQAWPTISSLTVAQAQGGTLSGTKTAVTAGEGVASFNDLPLGVYLVTETNAPSNITSKVAPFLVTLPLPQTNGKWLYDVSVYPKNQQANPPKKSVADANGFTVGSTVVWTITQDIPKLNKVDSFKTFSVKDDLDSRLALKQDDVVVKIGDTVVPKGDYDFSGNTVITFNETGRALLKDNQGKKLTIDLPTTVLADANGIIDNKAITNINDGQQTSNTVTSNWGKLTVHKQDSADHSVVLKGAEFDVFSGPNATGDKVGHLVTGENGEATITLFVGSNGVKSRQYSIKETMAPAGYNLVETPINVDVVSNTTTSTTIQAVDNPQATHPDLPLTGANGQLLATIGGGALVLLAAGSALILARRRQQQH